jgi:copper chaperone
MESTVRLRIDGMHCEGCVRRVTQALAGVDGVYVKQVEVGAATVSIDPARATAEKAAAAVNGIGFVARLDENAGHESQSR